MADGAIKIIRRVADLASRKTGASPISIRHLATDLKTGKIVAQGFYKPDETGRWRAVSPPPNEIN